MPPKGRVEGAEDKKEVPPAKKTKKEKIKETVNHLEEVAHILEDYRRGLFELLQIIAVKFDKMMDGLAETIIRESLNEFDERIMERKTPEQDAPGAPATSGAAESRWMREIFNAQMARDIELYETPRNSKITDRE